MKSTYVFFCILCISALGCKKNKPPKPIDYTPYKTDLVFPANNEACYSGTITSPTQSKVPFQWSSATNAQTYELTIKNLFTGEVSVTVPTSDTKVDVSLLQNTPYSWFITAKTSKTSAISFSDTWKFYNSGPAVKSYAPFPAEIVVPTFNQSISAVSGKITLTWIGSDVDNDITGYSVYFGTDSATLIKQPDLGTSTSVDIDVVSKVTYYWYVITTDLKGNTSNSGLYQFTTN